MNEAVFKTILHRVKGTPNNQEKSGEPESPPAETIATQVLAEYEPSEAHRIVKAWNDILGVNYLNPDRVKEHLEMLRKWQRSWQRE